MARRQRLQDEGAYQVDIVVTFFAILLVLFVVYAAAKQTQMAETAQLAFKPKEEGQLFFRDRAFAVPHRFRSMWILRNATLYELDMPAIAKALEKASGDDTSILDGEKVVDIFLTPIERGLGRYRLRLIFSGDDLPAAAYRFKASLPQQWRQALQRMLRAQRSILLFVWRDQVPQLADMLPDIRKKAVPLDIYMLPKGKNSILISNENTLYGLDDIMRTY